MLVHSRTKFQPVHKNSLKLDNFEKILQKFKIWKSSNASIDFGQIQYQRSFIDILYLRVVLGQYLQFYEFILFFHENVHSSQVYN